MEVTDAMVTAALKKWPDNWIARTSSLDEEEARRYNQMKNALEAAIDAAPSGHGERG